MSFMVPSQGNETTAENKKNRAESTAEGPNPELQLKELPL